MRPNILICDRGILISISLLGYAPIPILFKNIYTFIYLLIERQNYSKREDGETEAKIFSLLAHFPQGPNG